MKLDRESKGRARREIRLAYVVTHPIQYQAPLFRRLSLIPEIELKVFFQSDVSVHEYYDKGFNQTIHWNTPLLDGYDYEFLPSIGSAKTVSVWLPLSYDLLWRLIAGRFDAVILFGYVRPISVLAGLVSLVLGKRVFLRDDVNDKGGTRRKLVEAAKALYVKAYACLGGEYLAIGKRNAEYLEALGMPPSRIHVMPYAVDNERFRLGSSLSEDESKLERAGLNLENDRPIILFASKLQQKKAPLDLLFAYKRLLEKSDPAAPQPYLLIVGNGELLQECEIYVKENGLDGVRFAGFRNQDELPRIFSLASFLVLPSHDEPWGLIINEFMNAGRPVIVSDVVGCAPDLVLDGQTGFIFPVGDREALADRMNYLLRNPAMSILMGEQARLRVSEYSFDENSRVVLNALNNDRRSLRFVEEAR